MTTYVLIIMITTVSGGFGVRNIEVEYVPFRSEASCSAAAKTVRLAATLDPHRSVANIYAQCFRS